MRFPIGVRSAGPAVTMTGRHRQELRMDELGVRVKNSWCSRPTWAAKKNPKHTSCSTWPATNSASRLPCQPTRAPPAGNSSAG